MVLDWALLKNPLNWATVILMLVIAAMFGHLLLTYFGVNPAGTESAK